MKPVSTVLIGNESLLIGCAEMLLAQAHHVKRVVSTNPDISLWAQNHEIACSSDFSHVEPGFDWLLSIANLRILPSDLIAKAEKGAINFHDGPLPERAGLNTPNWAIIEGSKTHGITWHLIEGGVDEGDILAQRLFEITTEDTAFSLNSKCYAEALESFSEVLTQIASDELERQPQDLTARAYYAKADLPAGGGRLDFSQSSSTIAHLVRGLDMGDHWNPLTSPKLELPNGEVLYVGRAETLQHKATCGEIVGKDAEALEVGTKDGAIRLSDLATTEGETAQALSHVSVGDVLPSPSDEEQKELKKALTQAKRGDAFWRCALQQYHPLELPFGTPDQTGPASEAQIDLPSGLSKADIAAVVLSWALKSADEDQGSIALGLDHADTVFDAYVSNWAPLSGRQSHTLAALSAELAPLIARAETTGGFARDLPHRAPELARLHAPKIQLQFSGTARPKSGVTIAVEESRIRLAIHATELSPLALELFANRLRLALECLPHERERPISDQSLLPASERQLLLTDWNDTACVYPREQSIHEAFEAQVTQTPDAVALVFEDQQLTYRALNSRANALGKHLQVLGVGPGSHVGIHLKRSLDLVIASLAVFKAGGAYVPLDPAYPADRIAHYVNDSQANVVITQDAISSDLPESRAQKVVLDQLRLEPLQDNIESHVTSDNLAYLIYTSGSTGLPKGVMVRHRNVANFFTAMDSEIPYKDGDSWLAVTSLSFDISVLELFWTLARGFKLVLSSDESRLELSNGPVGLTDRKMDFNLFYWGNDDGAGEKKYELLLEGAKFADANGFNAVWTPERHFHAFGGPYPNPSVTGAAVAAVTRNIGVRAGSCVAPLHHTARIAEEWAVIDNLTNGQAGIGFASGWQPDDFILRPENTPPQNKPAMFEAIEAVRKLWRGEEVAFPRADGSDHSVLTQPRPVSKELPVWVTTAGNPETWKEAGRIGANVLTHLLGQSIGEVGEKIKLYHQALREAGHDPDDFTVTLMLHTYLDQSRGKAREIARAPMKDYLRSAAALIKQYAWAFPAFKKPKGVENAFDLDLGSLNAEELEGILDFAFERYFQDSGLFGTVEDALRRVEELKQIGVNEVACLIDFGIAPSVVLEGLNPLAEVVHQSNKTQKLADDDFSLAAQIVRHRVTHLQCTPSMARIIALDPHARAVLSQVSHLLVGGEALAADLVSSLRQATRAAIHNMYGPTETTIWSTVEHIDSTPDGVANVGKPIANTSVYVLDPHDQPVPIGVPGELCIGGAGVTAGYWQRHELTAERFPADPFTSDGVMYRTGDLVRWRADGKLDFLGRTDHQVKIRGQRIELGEIETALAACKGVTAAVVIPRKFGEGERLVGYITSDARVNEEALKRQLAAQLAEVMVPSHIVEVPEFPLTPNKKIDRKALPDPDLSSARASTVVELRNGTEQAIADIWRKLLGVATIASNDNFFALGGHSLLAVQAHREIRDQLHAPHLNITDIFRFPTLDTLASFVDRPTESTAQVSNTNESTSEALFDREATMAQRREMRRKRAERLRA